MDAISILLTQTGAETMIVKLSSLPKCVVPVEEEIVILVLKMKKAQVVQ